ncbi:hypothetical protein [Wolbachia endosymbiont of Ctenocephalides felis wCfeJ]|uniref:hypothetical protein n=1 Tax=Wolbachia endosymbiont of Ctenocephalides felis wCfeJ TaxID=2732594 RepID=UPI0014486BA0|nr:hypothetical protein [Wolbachia endosymbiont of Ctenocephalides felis wCfeJ]
MKIRLDSSVTRWNDTFRKWTSAGMTRLWMSSQCSDTGIQASIIIKMLCFKLKLATFYVHKISLASKLYWIPVSSTGVTPFDENKKSLIFDSI